MVLKVLSNQIKNALPNSISNNQNAHVDDKYFEYGRLSRRGDPISAYLFILVLEAVYCAIKSNKNIKGLNIFNDQFLYTAYAGDTLFLKVKISVFKTLHSFLCFFLDQVLTLQNVKQPVLVH